MGGALDLFSTNNVNLPEFPVSKKIYPKNNQFVFFKVSKKSFHQVDEVLNFDYPRLTINGWFHGFTDNKDFDEDHIKFLIEPLVYTPQLKMSIELNEFINDEYLKADIKNSIQQSIEENSETALEEYFAPDFYDAILDCLTGDKLKWNLKSPANQHRYEVLDQKCVKKVSPLQELINLSKSKAFFELLKEYTELDLVQVNCEVKRFSGGDYTLIGDASSFQECSLDLVMHFGENMKSGIITYLTPEQENENDLEEEKVADEEADDPVLLTIYPKKNVLNLVYRNEGTAKFTKYCYKAAPFKEYTYLLTCSYKE